MKKRILLILALVLLLGIGGFGAWKYYDATVDRSGWDGRGGYRDFHGRNVTGWQDVEGQRYYFGEDGARVTFWQDLEGNRYYFGSDGAMTTQWQDIEGSRYYFGVDGILCTGWQEIAGGRYYLGSDGVMATQWQQVDGNRYFFGNDGIMRTGTQTLEGTVFCFRDDGVQITGWQEGRYYLPEGGFATGWLELDNKQYCLDENGMIRTGWFEDGQYRYYLLSDGSAAVGPLEIDGKTWHFSPTGVQIYLVNDTYRLHEDYEPNLVQAGGTWIDAAMAEALEQMLADCKAQKLYPAVVSGYRTYWDQKYLYNNLLNTRGEIAKLYSAQPNASEHQLGLAVDIVESSYRTMNASQENTPTFRWFKEHCWDYGFIIRYPNGSTDITGIAYEPWHYRYVGVEIALELKELGITLEEYLGVA